MCAESLSTLLSRGGVANSSGPTGLRYGQLQELGPKGLHLEQGAEETRLICMDKQGCPAGHTRLPGGPGNAQGMPKQSASVSEHFQVPDPRSC
jgi:hypothetical protein